MTSTAVLLAPVIFGLGALAWWLVWRTHPRRRLVQAWGTRLQDSTFVESVGLVEVDEPISAWLESVPAAHSVVYVAAEQWQPDGDLARIDDQMNVWSRRTRTAPFVVVTDAGERLRVVIDSTSLVHVPTRVCGTDGERELGRLPRGKYGSALATFWEMSLRPGDRVRIFARRHTTSTTQGSYRQAGVTETELEPGVLVCSPDFTRTQLLTDHLTEVRSSIVLRLLASAFVAVMVLSALSAVAF